MAYRQGPERDHAWHAGCSGILPKIATGAAGQSVFLRYPAIIPPDRMLHAAGRCVRALCTAASQYILCLIAYAVAASYLYIIELTYRDIVIQNQTNYIAVLTT